MRSDVELEAPGTSLGAPPAVTITRRAGGSAWVVDLGSTGESGNRRSGVLFVIFERQFEEHQHFSTTIEKYQLAKQQEERASDLAEYRAAQQRQAERLKTAARAAGIPILEGDTHIVPVMVGDAAATMRICQLLLAEHGIYVQPINYPTVPRGTERLRLTPGPFHTDEMVDQLVTALQSVMDQVSDEGAQATVAE